MAAGAGHSAELGPIVEAKGHYFGQTPCLRCGCGYDGLVVVVWRLGTRQQGNSTRRSSVVRKFLGIGDPVVPTTYPAELVRLVAERGVDERRLLEGTGIESVMLRSPKARISYKQLRSLVQASIVLSRDPSLGLTLGPRFVMGRWGALGYATLNASKFGEAVELIVKYGALLVPHIEFTLHRDGEYMVMRLEQFIRLGALRCFASEAIVGALLAQLQLVLGRSPDVERVRFDYSAPSYANQYAPTLGHPIEFDAEATEVVFHARCWDAPLLYSCASSAAVAEQQCLQELEATQERKSVVSQVRHLLRNRDEGFPDVRTAARSLRTSERSLRRALHESGTSYQTLMDETRRDLAMDYLQSTRVPVEDIARMAGFADGRSFRRAFKRWTGMTPGEARRA